MSTIYNKTDNYALNLYGDNDPADLRDGYNGSMRTIDTTLEQHLNRIESMESRETHDEEVAKALLGDNTVDAANAAKTKWDKAGTDATKAQSTANAATATANDAVGRLNALGVTDNDTASTSKTRWDEAASLAATNENAITAINENLNALHANTVSDAGNLYTRIITAGGRGGHMVIIGDSITAGQGLDSPQTQAYPYYLAQTLGMTAHVYAQSGAGFAAAAGVSPYNTLGMLCNQAVNDGSYDHSQVNIVLLMGGINDGYDQADTARNNAVSALNSLHDSFPNAQVYFGICPTCGLSRQNNKTVYSGIPAIAENVQKLKSINTSLSWMCHIIDAWTLLWPNQALTTDGLHPNSYGHKYLAGAILSAMSGQSCTMTPSTASLWEAGGGTRMIESADQIPEVERYSWIKTHFVSSRNIWPNLFSSDGRSWTYKASLATQLTLSFDETPPSGVFYFPISILPTCLQFYRKDGEYPSYDPTFQFYQVAVNKQIDGEGAQFLFIWQYNMRYNTTEVAISGNKWPTSGNLQFTIATPTITIPIPIMNQ